MRLEIMKKTTGKFSKNSRQSTVTANTSSVELIFVVTCSEYSGCNYRKMGFGGNKTIVRCITSTNHAWATPKSKPVVALSLYETLITSIYIYLIVSSKSISS